MPKHTIMPDFVSRLTEQLWTSAKEFNVNAKRDRFKKTSDQITASGLKPAVKRMVGKGPSAALRGFAANPLGAIGRYMPIVQWGLNYKREDLSGDILAGTVVAIMLMPQSMAYAMLAGLPAQIGLYTAVVPLVLYALFGSSRTLGIGPVAIVSLMVATTLGAMNLTPGQYLGYAIILAFLSGLILVAAGIFRLGFITNFIGHPVIAGFTTAGALIIAFSQLKHILGIDLSGGHNIFHILQEAYAKANLINPTTLLLSLSGIMLMASRGPVTAKLREFGVSEALAVALPKGMSLFLVVFSTVFVWGFNVNTTSGVQIVGAIPAGLPSLQLPTFDRALWEQLLPAALLISVVGLVESLSVAKALATRKRQKIDPNQELIGLGASNFGAAFTGGYPVTGSFSRSVVNFTSGANTQLSAIITAALIALVLIFFTPLLHFLPKATLAVIIVMAVSKLIDFSPFFSSWKYYKPDGLAFLATFVAVLSYGVEIGILSGIALSIGMYLWRMSRPRMPVLGRVGDSQDFRSTTHHDVQTYDKILILRVDENLFFANAAYLEERMLAEIADHPEVKHLVLVMNTVSLIDASALETLENLIDSYRDAGVLIHMAGLKTPVMDMLERSHFLKHLSPGEIFMSPHEAVNELTGANKAKPEQQAALPTPGESRNHDADLEEDEPTAANHNKNGAHDSPPSSAAQKPTIAAKSRT